MDATGDVDVLARDNSAILAQLFSASVAAGGSGTVAVGISVAVTVANNTIGGSTLATIADSDVETTAGAVKVEALSERLDQLGLGEQGKGSAATTSGREQTRPDPS